MGDTRTRAIVVLAAAALLLPTSSCVCVGERAELIDTVNETHTVELEGAERVIVRLDVGIGAFHIKSGSDALMEAEFEYNIAEWEPEVSYKVTDGTGRLTIRQPSLGPKSVPDDAKSEWTLVLNKDVPLELDIDMGVGKARLFLGDLWLTDLSVDHGVGDLYIDLSGDKKDDLYASLEGGVGKIVLTVPESVGARVDVDTGIGSVNTHGLRKRGGALVNDAYGETDVTVDVSLDAGIGSITVETSDTGSLRA